MKEKAVGRNDSPQHKAMQLVHCDFDLYMEQRVVDWCKQERISPRTFRRVVHVLHDANCLAHKFSENGTQQR